MLLSSHKGSFSLHGIPRKDTILKGVFRFLFWGSGVFGMRLTPPDLRSGLRTVVAFRLHGSKLECSGASG